MNKAWFCPRINSQTIVETLRKVRYSAEELSIGYTRILSLSEEVFPDL